MVRRAASGLVAAGFAVLLASGAVHAYLVLRALRTDAARSGQMFAHVFKGLTDTSADARTTALIGLDTMIINMGVPFILTDERGISACANLPFCAPLDTARARAYLPTLDRQNIPVGDPAGRQVVHFGNTPLVRALRIVPWLQLVTLSLLVLAVVVVARIRASADRERVWAGMAREAAHQLGTPLSSLSGWVELLSHPDTSELAGAAVAHMQDDLERLERVAHRFEHIGRPPRRERVNLGQLAERVAVYFRARVPTLAHAVTIATTPDDTPVIVEGDPVLLEWAVESLVRNALDALSGRGGEIALSVTLMPEGAVRLRVADDGPGVPREMRSRIFEPGFSTKPSGWGIGLSLARRIIEENHGGTLRYVASDTGATFDITIG